MSETFEIVLSEEAVADFEAITDRRTQEAIERKIDELETDPDKRGKALSGLLSNYRSVRAAGQRYRVIYQVAMIERQVVVVVIGIRKEGDKKDAYAVAEKRLG